MLLRAGPGSTRQGLQLRLTFLATTAWDEEFRIPVFAVAGETEQFLHVRAMRQEREGDDELIGEAKVLLDGSWTEYDGESADLLDMKRGLASFERLPPGCYGTLTPPRHAEWVAVKQDGKYRGEVYLELTWYPRQDVSHLHTTKKVITISDDALQIDDPAVPQPHPSELGPAASSASLGPGTAEAGPATVEGIQFVPRPRRDPGLDFAHTAPSRPPPVPPKDDLLTPPETSPSPVAGIGPRSTTPATTAFPGVVRTPSPLESPRAAGLFAEAPGPVATGAASLPPRLEAMTLRSAPPPVPPRPASASPRNPDSTFSGPPRPESAHRPLPSTPDGLGRTPGESPLDAKRREAAESQAAGSLVAAAPPPAYGAAPQGDGPSFPGAFPTPGSHRGSFEQTRPHAGTSDGTAAERLEEIRRREEEERSRRARLEREEAIRLQQAEARRQEQEARQQRLEQERLEAIRASQRAREARIRQEQEDAAIAARLAAEAEEAERRQIEARKAEDEALVQRLLEEEQAEEARQLREREQADEAFVRQLREEDRRREEEERKAREDADAEFARKMREEEDAERRQRLEEDERIARSLAEQDETSRTGPMETTVP